MHAAQEGILSVRLGGASDDMLLFAACLAALRMPGATALVSSEAGPTLNADGETTPSARRFQVERRPGSLCSRGCRLRGWDQGKGHRLSSHVPVEHVIQLRLNVKRDLGPAVGEHLEIRICILARLRPCQPWLCIASIGIVASIAIAPRAFISSVFTAITHVIHHLWQGRSGCTAECKLPLRRWLPLKESHVNFSMGSMRDLLDAMLIEQPLGI